MIGIQTMTDVEEVLLRLIPTASTATKDYSLVRMEKLMKALGDPQNRLKVIHIAGTSGKTSTSYYIAALLKEAGHSVGLSISPHVDTVRERIQLDGEILSEQKFVSHFGAFLSKMEASGVEPSYFECLIAFAYWVFDQEKVEYAVIEVGLGGQKDATNVVDREDKVCVITDIGLDHTEILGETLDKIAEAKSGIITDGNRVFMYEQAAEVMAVIDNVVAEKKANLEIVNPDTSRMSLEHLPLFQRRNWLLAVTVAESILEDELSPEQLQTASETGVPARMEIIKLGDKMIIMDGAHNGQKMKSLIASVVHQFPEQKVSVLAAFVKVNNPRAFEAIEELLPVAKDIIFTAFKGNQDTPKVSMNPDILSDYVKTRGFWEVRVIDNPGAAYQQLLQSDSPILLITGSFYLMNHIRPLIKGLQK